MLSEIIQTRQGQIVQDITSMKYPEQSDSQTQEVEQWLSGAEGAGNGELLFNGYRVSAWEYEKFWRRLHNNVNVLKATEFT